MLIPRFQNNHAIFPIRSPEVFDFFKQETDMLMNGLTYEEYFSNIFKKLPSEGKWTQQWTEKLNEQYSPPLYINVNSTRSMNNADALSLFTFVQERYGNFKLNTKFKDEWRALMKGDFTKAALNLLPVTSKPIRKRECVTIK